MKILNNIILLSLFAALSFTFNACENSTYNEKEIADSLFIINIDEFANVLLECGDSIKITFNHKISFTPAEIADSFILKRKTVDIYNYERSSYDTLSYTYSVSNDQKSIFIKPKELFFKNQLLLVIATKYLEIYEENRRYGFHVPKYSNGLQLFTNHQRLIAIHTKPNSTNDTIPIKLEEYNKKTIYKSRFYGDTTYAFVPFRFLEYKFLRWENYDPQYMFPDTTSSGENSILKMIINCENMRPIEIYAIYEKIK